ncbi:MAG: TIGR00730 family Rossman fold protein [Elsteraceae bacterium]
MHPIRSLCVFCGSKPGTDPHYHQAAIALGQGLAANGVALVYGGGRVGLMGAVADACKDAGGRVIGVIPDFLEKREVGHREIDELIVVDSMHARKRLMVDRSDAFAVLPGGFGTLDETFEVLTWAQLSLHAKPVLLLNVGGYWDPLAALIDHMMAKGLVEPRLKGVYQFVDTVPDLLARLTRLPSGGPVASEKF